MTSRLQAIASKAIDYRSGAKFSDCQPAVIPFGCLIIRRSTIGLIIEVAEGFCMACESYTDMGFFLQSNIKIEKVTRAQVLKGIMHKDLGAVEFFVMNCRFSAFYI